MAAERPTAALLESGTSAAQKHTLEVAREVARDLEVPLYLVGGATRDLLLAGRLRDLDLLVEGDRGDYARELARRLGADLRWHERFLTAEILLPDQWVDIATARTERYPAPAVLPEIEPGAVVDDLARRDFGVNAMALRLFPPAPEPLVDPFGGRQDLIRRWLRVLHERSFVDDPTRILRGVRLAARLGFRFESRTAELAVAAIESGAFEPLSGSRLRQELVLLLDEDAALEDALELWAGLGGLRVLHPALELSERVRRELRAVTAFRRGQTPSAQLWADARVWLVRLVSLLKGQDRSALESVARRLDLEGPTADLLTEFPGRIERAGAALRDAGVSPHRVRRVLDDLAPELRIALVLEGDPRISNWLVRWGEDLRRVQLLIRGEDLIAEGFRPGPAIGLALRATLDARVDGTIAASEELQFAVSRLVRASSKGGEVA